MWLKSHFYYMHDNIVKIYQNEEKKNIYKFESHSEKLCA